MSTRIVVLAGTTAAAVALAGCQPPPGPPASGATPAPVVSTPAPGGAVGGGMGAAGSPSPAPTTPPTRSSTAAPTKAPAPSPTAAPTTNPPTNTPPPASGGSAPGPTSLNTNYPIPAGAVFVAPGGSDAAAGTVGAPLRTVAAALAAAPAGGTVVLRAGVYRESLASVTRRVTLQPYPHEEAWFSGSDVVTGWQASGRGWRSTTWRTPLCQTCYNPQAVDSGHPLAGSPDQVFVNGRELTQVANDAALTANSFYLAADGAAVIGTNPAGAQVEASTRWKALQLNDNAGGSVIRGLGFRQYAPTWNETQLAAVILNTTDVTFTGNVVTQMAGTGVAVTQAGAKLTGNTIFANGYRGLVANRADGLLLNGNHFDGNNTAGFNTSSCGSYCTVAGVKVAHTRGVVVTGNSFAHNAGAGFWCDLGCITGTITGNTVTDNAGNGLFYEVSANGTISGNTIAGNGRGLKVSGATNVAVSANRFVDNTIDLGVYDDPRSPSTDPFSLAGGLSWNTGNVTVTGNTFVDSGGKTSTVLDTNATTQVNARGMIRSFTGNSIQPADAGGVYWCEAKCVTYPTVGAFTAAVPIG